MGQNNQLPGGVFQPLKKKKRKFAQFASRARQGFCSHETPSRKAQRKILVPALLSVPAFNSLLQRRVSREEFAGKCFQRLPRSSKITRARLGSRAEQVTQRAPAAPLCSDFLSHSCLDPGFPLQSMHWMLRASCRAAEGFGGHRKGGQGRFRHSLPQFSGHSCSLDLQHPKKLGWAGLGWQSPQHTVVPSSP